MEYKGKLETNVVADTYPSEAAPGIEANLHCLLNALESMDRRTALELERLDGSCAEEDLKEFIKQDILSRHQARRQSLQDATEALRAQYRAVCLSDGD
jgi:hypothetical protein